MAATAHTKVFWPAGSICCSDQPPASNDVESCSAPLRGLTIRYQKRAVLFPRRHGLPTCENCAWGALGGRQQRARFAHLGLRTASPCKLSIAFWGRKSRFRLLFPLAPPLPTFGYVHIHHNAIQHTNDTLSIELSTKLSELAISQHSSPRAPAATWP